MCTGPESYPVPMTATLSCSSFPSLFDVFLKRRGELFHFLVDLGIRGMRVDAEGRAQPSVHHSHGDVNGPGVDVIRSGKHSLLVFLLAGVAGAVVRAAMLRDHLLAQDLLHVVVYVPAGLGHRRRPELLRPAFPRRPAVGRMTVSSVLQSPAGSWSFRKEQARNPCESAILNRALISPQPNDDVSPASGTGR